MIPPEVLEAVEGWVRQVVRDEVAPLIQMLAPERREWFNLEQSAQYLCVSQRTLERLVANRELRSTNVERRRIVRREWLDEYAEAREGAAPTTPPRLRSGVRYAVPTTPHGGQHAR